MEETIIHQHLRKNGYPKQLINRLLQLYTTKTHPTPSIVNNRQADDPPPNPPADHRASNHPHPLNPHRHQPPPPPSETRTVNRHRNHQLAQHCTDPTHRRHPEPTLTKSKSTKQLIHQLNHAPIIKQPQDPSMTPTCKYTKIHLKQDKKKHTDHFPTYQLYHNE